MKARTEALQSEIADQCLGAQLWSSAGMSGDEGAMNSRTQVEIHASRN